MKTLFKLVVVALMANAIWRVGVAYSSFYKFKDSVYAAAMQEGLTDEQLRQKIVELASTYDVPLTADGITLQREQNHTVVLGSYSTPVAVLPGYDYQWPFDVNVDAYVVAPPTRRNDLVKP